MTNNLAMNANTLLGIVITYVIIGTSTFFQMPQHKNREACTHMSYVLWIFSQKSVIFTHSERIYSTTGNKMYFVPSDGK